MPTKRSNRLGDADPAERHRTNPPPASWPLVDALSSTIALAAPRPWRSSLKLAAMHAWRNGYWPDLANPMTFNEFVQARKLWDRNPLMPVLADKVKVKDFVASRLGQEWLIPTLWHGTELPPVPEWPLPFVLKSNHASCQCAFVRTGQEDWQHIRRKAHRWLGRAYGGILDEWLYGQIEPRLLVEPFIGRCAALPLDYKLFVFGGRAEFIQVDTDREHSHKRAIFDRSWRKLPVTLQYPAEPRDLPRPASLTQMIGAAEALGRGFDFVRADFYEVDGRPLFGELSFYPGSGLDRFQPFAFDRLLGDHWRAARACRSGW